MSATTEFFIALSPDGLLITSDFVPKPLEETETELKNWIQRYKAQGHYTDMRMERIPFDEIYNECYLLPMNTKSIVDQFNLEKFACGQPHRFDFEKQINYNCED